MIPKKIFYCWFGRGEMTELNKKCIATWKNVCPDYEIIEINETNWDVASTPYSKLGYEKGNWSAVSNTARLDILRKEGGFYLDTDVQLVKPLDDLRKYDKGFITEFDSAEPDSGVLGCSKDGFPWLYDVAYEELGVGTVLHKNFIRNMFAKYDVHGESVTTYDDGFTILGEEWFPTVRTGLITEKTIGIHYFENTWVKNQLTVTDIFYPYQRVNLYVAGNLVNSENGATVNLYLKNRLKKWNGPEILGRANYFFNPKVVKIESRDFNAVRIGYEFTGKEKTCVTSSTMIVTYKED